MQTNLEQAIAAVAHSSKPITLATIFPAYMRVAGFDLLANPPSPDYEALDPASQWQLFNTSVCGDARASFEHAMDKQSLGSRRDYAEEIARLREEYWKNWHGANTSRKHGKCGCRCKTCGMPLRPPGESAGAGPTPTDDAPPPERRKRRLKKRVKRTKRPQSVTSDSSSATSGAWDPYGPSTSAVLL
ncbi:hypothetical protein PUNSTDRAFT_141039 [Punctularia strigosozonata HHB-11173 SS5]|uniref:uncharacterized protein n=1 Tax=Punctularia strigosozonata (strain HHB-11173) TaxID=741275 RepID=UPI000441736F|nr:uncharacterized protein PUNSTDRAFT_141039 [Punctularia strigosozonata HHB-11173 SS5]EIN12283.1 hypothetical protein PUNSTDRAFT_141039 [Punctularia strigosozonata HHB-11173 SS5]